MVSEGGHHGDLSSQHIFRMRVREAISDTIKSILYESFIHHSFGFGEITLLSFAHDRHFM